MSHPGDEREICAGCGGGDKVPARGYWKCSVCDAEWNDDYEEPEEDDGEGPFTRTNPFGEKDRGTICRSKT